MNLADRKLFALQMYRAWAPVLGVSEEENERAIEVAFKAQEDYDSGLRKKARETLETLERENRIGIVMLGASVSPRSWREPRDHGRVSEARLPDLLAEHAAHR